MKKVLITIFGLFAFLLILSCGSKSKLTNANRGQFKVKELDSCLAKEIIDLDVAIIPIPKPAPKVPEKPKTFFDLNDSTQNVFIKTIAGLTDNADSLISFIKKPLSDVKASSANYRTDYTEIPIRFSISALKNYASFDKANNFSSKRNMTFLHHNTRLDYLNTTLSLGGNGELEILTIDRLQNIKEDIDLGTISRTNTATFNSKASGNYGLDLNNQVNSGSENSVNTNPTTTATVNEYDEFGNLINSYTTSLADTSTSNLKNGASRGVALKKGINAEIGYNNIDVLNEALLSKIKRLKTGFAFTDRSIKISQRADILRDVSDNNLITATLVARDSLVGNRTISTFKNLFENGLEVKASDIKYHNRTIRYIPCFDKLYKGYKIPITVSVNGVIRAVKNEFRGRSNYEYDEKVIYHVFEYENNDYMEEDLSVELFRHCTKVQKMYVQFSGDINRHYLHITEPAEEHVHFLEDEDPQRFRLWLKSIKENPSASKLQRDDIQLFFADTSGVKTYLINKVIASTDINKLRTIQYIGFEYVDRDN
ncbi:MAG: hypothetical protein WBG71_12325 [Leeuwenhoekiella sp.]